MANNDSFIKSVCLTTLEKSAIVSPPKTLTRMAWNKCDLEPIKCHINSFNPCVAHYRREHAPNRKYLPNEISASFMHSDFLEKNPGTKCSFDLYRRTLRQMNIYFTKLGHEECETCEEFNQHDTTHTKEMLNININCSICIKWSIHYDMYKSARAKYDWHRNKETNGKC